MGIISTHGMGPWSSLSGKLRGRTLQARLQRRDWGEAERSLSKSCSRFLLEMGERLWRASREELACSGVNKKLGYFHQPLGQKGSEASNGADTVFFLLESCHVPPQSISHG